MKLLKKIGASAWRIYAVALADLRSLSRAKGLGLERTLFVGVLLVAVASSWPGGRQNSVSAMSTYGTQIFMAFFLSAAISVFLLVPILFSGVFSAERRGENGLLVFTTPITTLELVAGRFTSHFLRVLVLFACGLPVLFSTMLFGGVSGSDLMNATLSLLALSVMLGGLTMFLSLLSGRAGVGGVSVILLLLGQGFASGIILALLSITRTRTDWLIPYLIPHFYVVFGLLEPLGPARGFPVALVECTLLGLLSLLLCALALRPICLHGLSRGTVAARSFASVSKGPPVRGGRQSTAPAPSRGGVYRGPVWSNPVAWKEFKVNAPATGWFERWGIRLLLFVGYPLALLYIISWEAPLSVVNTMMVGIELFILSMAVLNRASSSVTRELEANEFELLAVTPVTARQVLVGKWAGILRSIIPVGIVIVVHYLIWFMAGFLPGLYSNLTDSWGRRAPEFVPFVPSMLSFLCLAATAAVVGSLGLAVSVLVKKNTTAVSLASGLVLGWWLCIPMFLSGFMDEALIEATGMLNPFFLCCGWALVGFETEPKAIDLVLPSFLFLTSAAFACWGLAWFFLKRFDRAVDRI